MTSIKRLSLFFFPVICLLAGIFAVTSLAAVSPPINSLWPHEQSDLTPDPEVVFGRLPNGFRYALLQNPKPRDRTSLHLVVNAGSLNEKEDQRGIAHFLEHMLFNGSTHFAPGELVKYFQKIGMQFGPDANASTSFFRTVYDINLPQSDRDSLDEALIVMQDYAAGALLLQKEIDREREVILAEKRTRDSADYRTYVATMQFELAGTLFPERLPIGTEAVIREVDRQAFQDFYDTWYRPDNMTLVMVGDFDPATAAELIAKHFRGLQPRSEKGAEAEIGVLRPGSTPVFYHHEPEVGSTTLTLQALKSIAPRLDSANYKEERMADRLIGIMLQNRLDRILNQPDPPFTEASAGTGIFLQQIQYGYISADGPPENWQAALVEIEHVLRQALDYGFDAVEVDRARRDFAAELDRNVDQAATRESNRLARQLIHAIASDQVFQSPQQEKAFYTPLLAAVTTESLNARLRAVWRSGQRQTMMTGNADLAGMPDPPTKLIYDTYQAAAEQPVQAPQITRADKFPYLPEPPRSDGVPAARARIEDLGITRATLSNGIRLILKPTQFSANEVLFALSLEGGRAVEPKARPGLAELSRDVINESGVGGLDREALQIALTGKTTSLSFGFNNDRFFFQGASSPKEIELVFQLLHAHLADPAFRPEAFQLAQDRFAQAYRQMAQSVDAAFGLHAQRFFSGGDPRFGKPKLEEFRRLSLADTEDWIRPILAGAPLELAMVGDFELEKVIALAQQYLGGLAMRPSEYQEIEPGPVFPAGGREQVPVATQIDKALLLVAFPTDDARDIHRTRRLKILAEIFSDRLREEVREKRGAAYSPGAFSWPSRTYPGYGLFLSYLPVAPQAVEPVLGAVYNIARGLASTGITPEELERALEPTLTGIKEQLRQNDYWLHTVLMGATRHPEQIGWSRTILDDYAGIRPEELTAMARRYLVPENAAVFLARPATKAPARDEGAS
jgi:zinc protease